jgi:hypothetical protein
VARGRENSAGGGRVPFLKGAVGRQWRGVGRHVEAERGRARGARARQGNGSAAGSSPLPPGAGDGVATRQWMAAGSGQRGTARLTGGSGRDGAQSSAAG